MEDRASKKFAILATIFVLVLLLHGVGVQMQYAIDTYWQHWMGLSDAALDMLYRNGRPVMALLYWIASVFNISIEAFYFISVALAFFFLAFSVYLYQSIFVDMIDNDWIRVLVSFISISNIFIIEYFMFIEKGGFMLAVFFNVLAVYSIWRYLERKHKRYLLLSLMFMLLATLTYQGTIALFVILSLPIIYHYADRVINYIKYFLLVCAVYWLPVIIDMILFDTVFDSTRMGSNNYLQYIWFAFLNINWAYQGTYHILPSGVYLTLFVSIILISILAVCIARENIICNTFNIVLMVVVCSVVPTASIVAGAGWGCPRILYPLTSGFGILLLNYFINIRHSSEKAFLNGKMICTFLLVGMIVLEYISFMDIYLDKYRLNFADELRCIQIGQAIKEYEAETGNTITQIAFYYDSNIQDPYYNGVFSDGDLVMSGFIPWDSQLNMINYYLGTDYGRAMENVWYTNYYAQCDWDCYSQEQINFDDDTLNYCVY